MVDINIDLIKELRNATGVSIMQCKKALEEAGGDLEKAKIVLTKKSGEIAAKKGDRTLGAGKIVISGDDNKSIILELACETDFVANNEEFKALANSLSEKILNENLENANENEEVKTAVTEAVQKMGERIEIVRYEIIDGNLGTYVHSNGAFGSVVVFEGEANEELKKDIAMHIAAQNPKYLSNDDISEDERNKAKETLEEEVADKPAEMQEKILEGKMNAFFKERVLLSQGFIKDPNQTIESLLNNAGVKIVKFVRFGVGEE